MRRLLLAALTTGVAAAPAVAPQEVTIRTTESVIRIGDVARFTGTIEPRRDGVAVVLEQDDCGPVPWRPATTTDTHEGGQWGWGVQITATTRFRARVGSVVSRIVTVQARPLMELRPGRGSFVVVVRAAEHFHNRRVEVQRFDSRARRWRVVRTARLRRESGAGLFAVSRARVRALVPRGTLMRAYMADSQTGECYAAGFSPLVRT